MSTRKRRRLRPLASIRRKELNAESPRVSADCSAMNERPETTFGEMDSLHRILASRLRVFATWRCSIFGLRLTHRITAAIDQN